MSGLNDLIDAIIDGDTIEIQNRFNSEMADRLSSVLDVYKTEVAKNLFSDQTVEQEVELEEE